VFGLLVDWLDEDENNRKSSFSIRHEELFHRDTEQKKSNYPGSEIIALHTLAK